MIFQGGNSPGNQVAAERFFRSFLQDWEQNCEEILKKIVEIWGCWKVPKNGSFQWEKAKNARLGGKEIISGSERQARYFLFPDSE